MLGRLHRGRRIHGLTILLAVAAMGPAACGAPVDWEILLLDLDGRQVSPFVDPDTSAWVFIFARSDCPISNRYAPEIQRLSERFVDRGVEFRLVYVDPSESLAEVRAHLQDFGYSIEALRDPEHVLVRRTEANVTPEAVVFRPDGGGVELVYRGRIDNRYVDFGKYRPQATEHDLEDILQAILRGDDPGFTSTQAVGCYISDLVHHDHS